MTKDKTIEERLRSVETKVNILLGLLAGLTGLNVKELMTGMKISTTMIFNYLIKLF